MTYAYPTNVATVFDLMNYNNSITGMLFGNLLVLAFWCILFFSFKTTTVGEKSFTAASAATTIFALLLSVPGVVPGYVVAMLVAATVGSFLVIRD